MVVISSDNGNIPFGPFELLVGAFGGRRTLQPFKNNDPPRTVSWCYSSDAATSAENGPVSFPSGSGASASRMVVMNQASASMTASL
ncbi:hypothetical protein BH24ACT5_BH24ACT5_00280 [soil metagenome]